MGFGGTYPPPNVGRDGGTYVNCDDGGTGGKPGRVGDRGDDISVPGNGKLGLGYSYPVSICIGGCKGYVGCDGEKYAGGGGGGGGDFIIAMGANLGSAISGSCCFRNAEFKYLLYLSGKAMKIDDKSLASTSKLGLFAVAVIQSS